MDKDSIISELLKVKDSLLIKAEQTKNSTNNSSEITKALYTAFIGAVIAQAVILIIGYVKKRCLLKEKKNLIIADLSNQLKIIERLENKLNELDKKFENKDLLTHTSDAFQDLQTYIYESVSKSDLHIIFKSNIFKLVDIYKSIMFLQENSISNIYGNYIKKLELHRKEKVNISNHDFYCDSHLRFIELARNQIKNNLNTISDLKKDIDIILGSNISPALLGL